MTRRTHTTLVATALLLGATALSGPAGASTADAAAPVTRMADLKASGDADGSGHAMFTLNKAKKRVCADVTWAGIAKPNAAHIHKVSDGSIFIDLSGSVTGGKKCTTGVSKNKIQKLIDRPGRYYFNVHNGPYPAGAIQGTLRK
ncbi:CHRD domain-containing protein [Nocardioides bigeumensis]|uniref:CHRD domain-containing protein n=1 Tax=Nocardioides bigeumensis TaxID=433657 RepID=A0ABN2YZJ1_9ACTN